MHPTIYLYRLVKRKVRWFVVVLVILFLFGYLSQSKNDASSNQKLNSLPARKERMQSGENLDSYSTGTPPDTFIGIANDDTSLFEWKQPGDETAEDSRKIDWHDRKMMAMDQKRQGPGEQGRAAILDEQKHIPKEKLLKIYRGHGFNAFVSNAIALNRSVRDVRIKACNSKLYLAHLPTVSVIVSFYNEHYMTLLRTAYSVVKRSPPQLLKEVILADDFSTNSDLKKKLPVYLARHWPNKKVRLLRMQRREGLIRTRLAAARGASGQVIVFLDAHSECNYNWLPPLLEPIAQNYRTVVCPMIDTINFENFRYQLQDRTGARGVFDWELYYKRLPRVNMSKETETEPYDSPVMAGGYFAVSQEWFWELGGYDEGLNIWGGEQYELSFKIWLCGGRLVDAPCSHVGHIYRKFPPFRHGNMADYLSRNYKRVAEIWMDEYKEYMYRRRPHYRELDPGDLTKPKLLRKKLNCKPFKWFLDTVAFDLLEAYPLIEPESAAVGQVWNKGVNRCLVPRHVQDGKQFQLQKCAKWNASNSGHHRGFEFTWRKEMRTIAKRSMCLDVNSRLGSRAPIKLSKCHSRRGNQQWALRPVLPIKSAEKMILQIMHLSAKLCMDCDLKNNTIYMSPCLRTKETQQWMFEYANKTLIKSSKG